MARTVIVERRRRYQWPNAQLNFWVIIMLAASCVTLGIFASFIRAQNQLRLPIPWLFVFQICASGLAILFLFLIIYLISQRMLLPGIVILGSAILFVLWLTGTIEAALQLFGPTGNVNGDCQLYVNDNKIVGPNAGTLAYLQQHTICESWDAAFAFQIIGTVFLGWMMLMSWQVNRDEFE